MSRTRLMLTALPPSGTVFRDAEHTYTVLGSRDYRRKFGDKGESMLIIWEGHCAVCGQPFNTTSGPEVKALLRTCKLHRNQKGASSPVATLQLPSIDGRSLEATPLAGGFSTLARPTSAVPLQILAIDNERFVPWSRAYISDLHWSDGTVTSVRFSRDGPGGAPKLLTGADPEKRALALERLVDFAASWAILDEVTPVEPEPDEDA